MNSEEREERADNVISDDEGAEDLSGMLAPAESEFIIGEDKKSSNRTSLLLFAVVVAGLGGMYLMYQRSGPQPAGAATSEEADRAQQTINEFLNAGEASIQRMEQMLRETEQVVEQFHKYPSMKQIPLDELQANPFKLAADAAGPGVEPTAEQEAQRREAERLALAGQAAQLRVQSIMHGGARRACMINNTLYQEGQVVEGFVIEAIQPNAVVVQKGEHRFELVMRR